MARNNWLLGVLGGAVLLYLYSRTESGQIAIGDIVSNTVSGVRGIRNNNPGNIRRSGTAWVGLSPTQTDASFLQFSEMRWGIRAMAVILLTYLRSYSLDTVVGIISRWAPNTENDTQSYVTAVSKSVGVDPNDSLVLTDPDTLFLLVKAIIQHENGPAAAVIPDDTITEGVSLALGG